MSYDNIRFGWSIIHCKGTQVKISKYNSCWKILHAFLSYDFFQNQLFKKHFQEYHQSVKQFGSRSGLTLLRSQLIRIHTVFHSVCEYILIDPFHIVISLSNRSSIEKSIKSFLKMKGQIGY